MSTQAGRPSKLKAEHAPLVQSSLNAGAKRGEIARLLGVSSKTLKAFCLAHGIERRRDLKHTVRPDMVGEAIRYGEAYLKDIARRMERQGVPWSVADDEALAVGFLGRIVAALNSHDTTKGAGITTLLARAFEWSLATHLSENQERKAAFLALDRVGVEIKAVEPGDPGEAEYTILGLNTPKRFPRPDDAAAPESVPACDVTPDPIKAIVRGMQKPIGRNFTRTRIKTCPHCNTGRRGRPVTASEPEGLAPDDSRRNPCPYCFGRGGVSSNSVYISERTETPTTGQALASPSTDQPSLLPAPPTVRDENGKNPEAA
ncbi:MAG: hypothetical protein ACOZEN_13755 [Thermodesulfobacteriota bacterium]